ncbi:uncharacterized protein DDB_G0271670-like [Acropora millepora]|uniref:uncharacterized protein DDB_G0271670-like n=1 Tax=Acropora millepora TaxID=45264 RepID=UPI001CF40D28|nr:uncharacterized protein DDB_G0271670-like [Acropora millepora]
MSQNYSASDSDSDSDSAATNGAPPRRYNRRAFSRTFVHIEKRLKAAPSKNALSKLKDMGRVKEIAFTKNHSSAEIKQLLTSHFPTLGNLDMARLRIISSYDRGHSMSVVHEGVPNGEKIMQLFGGDAKKKVFLYWSPGTSSSSVPAVSSPCTSTVTSTTNAVTSSSSSTIGSFHMSTPAPNHATSSTSTISSTNSSSTTTTSTLAAPVSSGSPTLASIASPMSRPTNSRNETRRYLEHLATVSSLRHSTSDTDDNNDEAELLQSPFSHDVIEIDDPSPQSVSTQVSRWSRFQSNTGFMVKPFHGNGLKAGTVEEDLSPNGLGGSSLLTTSRSDEVVGCQGLLQTGSDQTAMLPFLIHSFDELCFQAGENNRGIIVVLLNTKITNEANRGAILRVLHKLETAEGKNWLFWVSSTWSSDGTKVIDLYGGDQKQDRLLFLAPSTGRNATLLGEISDTDTESNQIDSMLKKIIERAELRIMGQRQQR